MDRTEATAKAATGGTWKQPLGWLLGSGALLGGCLFVRQYLPTDDAKAQAPPANRQSTGQPVPAGRNNFLPKQPAAGGAVPEKMPVMAVVNNRQITRSQLAQTCMERYGKRVLESLTNKYLIAQHMQRGNISITRGEIDEEIERMAKRFHLGTEQWLQMLERERGVNYEQYSRDIIWPTLALRKLAADRLEVTPEELRIAHETEFGPSVQARLIAVTDAQIAERLRAEVLANPDSFSVVARKNSVDTVSASAGGLLQPIRLHTSEENIERVLFSMKAGDISPVVKVGEQFAIFKCERQIARRNVPMEQVQAQLVENIKEQKLREISDDVFRMVQQGAKVENVMNDPQKRQQMPGVAATVNGHPISTNELAEECLLRHGRDMLEGEINRQLLEQELARVNAKVTQPEIDAEIANAAILAGALTEDGQPDIKKWIDIVTQEQEVSYELYVRDAVWPSAALKKLVQAGVKVTEEDMEKGFEANYGQRVRCRAIVMSNLRRAQEVWNMARQKPDAEYFGKLAQQYSIEGGSGQLDGQVPPLRRYGGQPLLEDEAFKMQPGEISAVIQVGDKFVILFCEGFTEPVKIEIDEVRDLVHRDIFEKKVRLAMGDRFEKIREEATIDNYLAGTSQTPESKNILQGDKVGTTKDGGPRSAVVPASAIGPAVPRQR
jgi:parvulin-like peptidyl-prolyl isomerase